MLLDKGLYFAASESQFLYFIGSKDWDFLFLPLLQRHSFLIPPSPLRRGPGRGLFSN